MYQKITTVLQLLVCCVSKGYLVLMGDRGVYPRGISCNLLIVSTPTGKTQHLHTP